ncbi:2-octaprenyl-6-methoxyphenol hydroxylase/2-octaprenylphenol hydroxylase [Mariprofundus ferrinatatus]|uniref:2-octaprenyl-6-methoxyphenol hydroxylase/2-octaprenylphenol hydroxylase n=1 Tax=Mariprofundus ferrinatatus TaxID=1921087 RepID=A0A2K8LD34_9PROT|nr:UbiH/UbiF/VisC/COQ6 family ubiquinone biosynthesis hydroxylase [Mariprofundus ferrinatatus]ATX82196.1 2-octaprenyl-6-methoxyphenol hydroxylase/2-octaprenylphenol hydroxylase [Mariprofundus ferrinatatus]
MRTHADHADLIIVGGGMVGLGLACALRHSGLHIVIIERGEPPVFKSLDRDCRVSAIVMGNVKILQGIGVWKYLEKDAGPMRAMRIWDNQEQGGIRFDSHEIGEEALGYLIENSCTQRAMHKALLESENIEFCSPAEISEINWLGEHVEVHLADGRMLTTPLVVGADGGRSWIREQAGIGVWQRDYSQKGIVATVRPERGHNGVAFQRFLPTGPLAMLPMTDGLCSIVWSAENSEADRLMAMDEAAFLDALNLTFGPVLGRITETGERAAFPLIARLAKHFVRERVALVGDAAHCIHPLAGLGVNLGLRDAMVLAQEISDARRFDEDWGKMDVLERYMKQRLPDVLSVMGSMEGLHQVFTATIPGLKELRGAGMRLMGNSGAIKELLMRNSTGLSLPVPKQIS